MSLSEYAVMFVLAAIMRAEGQVRRDRQLQPSGATRVMKRRVVRCLQHHRYHNRLPELGSGLATRGKLLPRDEHRVLLGLPVFLGPIGPAVGRVVLDP